MTDHQPPPGPWQPDPPPWIVSAPRDREPPTVSAAPALAPPPTPADPHTPPWIVSGPIDQEPPTVSAAPALASPVVPETSGIPPWIVSAPRDQEPPAMSAAPATAPTVVSHPGPTTFSPLPPVPPTPAPPMAPPAPPMTPPTPSVEIETPLWITRVPPASEVPPQRSRLPLVLAGAAVVMVLVGGGGFLAIRQFGGAPDPGPSLTVAEPGAPVTEPATTEPARTEPPTTEPTTPPMTAPTTEATVDQQAALAELDRLTRQGLAQVSLGGQLVAQIASKNPGITDPYETTASGSHTFQAADILAEHEKLRDDPRNGDAKVVLLKSTDFGKRQIYHGQPLYVTFVVKAFGSESAVRSWCARRFPTLAGDALANQCAVRRLRPPA